MKKIAEKGQVSFMNITYNKLILISNMSQLDVSVSLFQSIKTVSQNVKRRTQTMAMRYGIQVLDGLVYWQIGWFTRILNTCFV